MVSYHPFGLDPTKTDTQVAQEGGDDALRTEQNRKVKDKAGGERKKKKKKRSPLTNWIQPPAQIMQIVCSLHRLPLPVQGPDAQRLDDALLRQRGAHDEPHPFLLRVLEARVRYLEAEGVARAELRGAQVASAAIDVAVVVAEAARLVGEGPGQADEVAVPVRVPL